TVQTTSGATVDVPCLRKYTLEDLNEFFLRYDAYKSNPRVSSPSSWIRLIDPALLSSLKDILGFGVIDSTEELKKFKKALYELDGPTSSFDLHTELAGVCMKKDLSVVSFIEYVKSFKAKVQQAPDVGVDKTIVGIFLKNSFPSAMYDSVIPELRLSGEEESLSVAIKKVGEELKDLRFAKKCYDTYGLEAFGLGPVKTGGLKAMSIHAVDGLPTMHRTGEIQEGPSIDRKDLYCDFCGRKGHAEKDCWIRA
ncbi:hypothetical protein ADUPG1_001526, partial [Aduncisulcus paluster]